MTGAMEKYIGKRVAKVFPGYGKKKFKGKVADVVKVRGNIYFRIHYDDGDAEDIDLDELKTILIDSEMGQNKRKAAEKPSKDSEKPPAAKSKSRKLSSEETQPRAGAAAFAGKEREKKEKAPGKKPSGADEESPLPSLAAVEAANARVSDLLAQEQPSVGKEAPAGEEEKEEEEMVVIDQGVGQKAADGEAGVGGLGQRLRGTLAAGVEGVKKVLRYSPDEQIPPSPPVGRGAGPVTAEQVPLEEVPEEEEKEEVEEEAGPSAPKAVSGSIGPDAVQRFPFLGGAKRLNRSFAIAGAVSTPDGWYHISDLIREVRLPIGQNRATPASFYEKPIKGVLRDLDLMLGQAGMGREHLVKVNVKLKDSEVAFETFCKAWNEYIGDNEPPAVTIGESYLGDESRLVAVSAVARASPHQAE